MVHDAYSSGIFVCIFQGGRFYLLHHYEGRYADMTSRRLLLEKLLLRPALYCMMTCHSNRFVTKDLRKHFPNAVIERYEIPFDYLLLRPHMNVVCLKE